MYCTRSARVLPSTAFPFVWGVLYSTALGFFVPLRAHFVFCILHIPRSARSYLVKYAFSASYSACLPCVPPSIQRMGLPAFLTDLPP